MEKEFILQEDSAMKIVGSLTRRRDSKGKTLKELLAEDSGKLRRLRLRRTVEPRLGQEEKRRAMQASRTLRTLTNRSEWAKRYL